MWNICVKVDKLFVGYSKIKYSTGLPWNNKFDLGDVRGVITIF